MHGNGLFRSDPKEIGRSGPDRRCCLRAHRRATHRRGRAAAVKGLTALPVCALYAGVSRGRICVSRSNIGTSVNRKIG